MRGGLFLLGNAAFFAVGTFYRAPFFLAVGMLGFLVWAYMLAAALIRRRRLRVFFAGRDTETTAREQTVLPVSVEEKGKLPPGSIRLRIRGMLRGKAETMRFTLSGNTEAETVFRHAGIVRLTIAKAEAGDPMGLFHLSIPEKDIPARETEITVYPGAKDGSGEAVPHALQPETVRARKDGSGREEIRVYSPGDPAHRIHWKLSARFDDLLVRRERGNDRPLLEIPTDDCAPSFEEDPDGFYTELSGRIRDALEEGYLVRVTDREGEAFLIAGPEETRILFRRLYGKEEK